MRQRITRKLMDRFRDRTPGPVKRLQVQVLMNLAAETFGLPGKRVWTRPYRKALGDYALFTVRCMRESEVSPDRLYDRAYALGSRIRRVCGLGEAEELKRLVFLLYRNIDITMEGELPGEIRVPHCYFSQWYDPGQCALMSCVDSGIVSGILGGGRLTFSCRITEGAPCCRARFKGN